MASGINKKLLAKKDMNFFREFTANAARAARMLGYAMVGGILVVFIVLGLIGYLAVRNFMKQQDIDAITAELAGPDYAGLEEKAKQLIRIFGILGSSFNRTTGSIRPDGSASNSVMDKSAPSFRQSEACSRISSIIFCFPSV